MLRIPLLIAILLAAWVASAAADPLMPADRFGALPISKASTQRLYLAVSDPEQRARLARKRPNAKQFWVARTGPAYDDIFLPGSPGWSHVRPYLRALGMSASAIRKTDPETLRTRMAGLQGAPLAIIADGLPQTLRNAGCGENMPGYGRPAALAETIRIVRAAGGNVRYVVWDEPFFFGHIFINSPSRSLAVGCRTPIPALADGLAETAAAARAEAPGLQFIEQFPIPRRAGVIDPSTWPRDVAAWVAAEKSRGIAPAVFIADIVATNPPDIGLIADANAQFRAAGIPFVDNCDGSGADQDEESWAEHGRQNCEMFARVPGIVPSDWVVVDSWDSMPAWGPETDPSSAMGIAAGLLGIRP